MTVEERVKAERAVGLEISNDFEARLAFKQDVDVSVYLRNMAERLAQASSELKMAPVGVFLISDYQNKWRCFSLPGNRIYLSVGLLKKMDFETQVAAAIAFEYGHILKRSVIERVKQNLATEPGQEAAPMVPEPVQVRSVEYFGPRGVFSYTEEAMFAAVEAAVSILYQSGYDPRGLSSLWEIYKKNPSKSPIESGTLEKIIQKTRRVIAQNAPLRNPVVRTNAFLEMHKRIKKL